MTRRIAIGLLAGLAGVVAGGLMGCETKPAPKPPTTQEQVDIKPAGPTGDQPLDPAAAAARVNQMLADLQRATANQAPSSQPSAVQWPQPTVPPTPPSPPPEQAIPAPAPETAATPATRPARNTAQRPNPRRPRSIAADAPVDLTTRVTTKANKDPRDVSAQLDLALLAYLNEQPSPDAARLAGLPAEDREIVSAVIDALVNLRAGVRADPNATYHSRVRPLAELSDRLRTKADLAVSGLAMTSEVRNFGVYEPMPHQLSSRGETRTVMYLEVDNFTSRPNDQRLWETRLSTEYTLYNASGRTVWSSKPVQTVDLCRNRRHDFFIPTLLRIPPQPPGKYSLKATVTDVSVGRVAEGVIQLESN